MTFLGTSGGNEIPLDGPDIPDNSLVLSDLATSISHLCRFNGHVRRFYSVAEHSVRVARILADRGHPTGIVRQGLIHDLHEAVCGDMPSPTKKVLGPAWDAFERKCMIAVRRRFRVPLDTFPSVRAVDLYLLGAEHRDLRAPHPSPWTHGTGEGYPTILPWDPLTAQETFLDECLRWGIV